MKAILFLGTLVFVASQAVASPNPGDIFNFVFDVIQDQVKGGHSPSGHGPGWGGPGGHHPGKPGPGPGWPPAPVNNKVILEHNGGNLLLGRVFIQNNGYDQVDFPACNASGNARVTHLIIRTQQSAVSLNQVRVTFANGQQIVLAQNLNLQNGQSTTWIPLDQARCVRSIKVWGQPFGPGPFAKTSVVSFVGYKEGF